MGNKGSLKGCPGFLVPWLLGAFYQTARSLTTRFCSLMGLVASRCVCGHWWRRHARAHLGQPWCGMRPWILRWEAWLEIDVCCNDFISSACFRLCCEAVLSAR